jgi:hypothetical protein
MAEWPNTRAGANGHRPFRLRCATARQVSFGLSDEDWMSLLHL